MPLYPLRYKLPAAHCTEIGRIITRFAFLESQLSKCIYMLLSLSPKQGRVAVRAGRIEDLLTTIEDLLYISKLEVPTNIKKIKTPLKNLERARDHFAHGVWVKYPGTKTPVLQITSGNSAISPGGASVKRRIEPAPAEVTLEDLKKRVRALDSAVKAVDRLGHQIDAVLHPASPKKS